MLNFIMKKYALSRQGAKDLVIATISCMVHNLTLMLPVSLLYLLVSDLYAGGVPQGHLWIYIVGMVAAGPHYDHYGGLHHARTVLFALDTRIFRFDDLHGHHRRLSFYLRLANGSCRAVGAARIARHRRIFR